MSGSRIYDIHQREVDDLKSATAFAAGVCTYLKRLLRAVKDDRPKFAVAAIRQFLDPYHLHSCLERVNHLIDPVGFPAKVPRESEEHRGTDGRHLPTCNDMRDCSSAHRAARAVQDTFRDYIRGVWSREYPTLLSPPDPLEAAIELTEKRWQEIRDELEEVVDFDCKGLLEAVRNESNAAIERCRESIVSPSPSDPQQPRGEPPPLPFDDPGEPVSARRLADRLGIPEDDSRNRETLRKRLETWRNDNLDGGWIEVSNRKPREPQYLYPIGKVWDLVQDLRPSV